MPRWALGLLVALAAALAVLATMVAVLVFAGPDATSIHDLVPGDCFDLPIDGDDVRIETVEVSDCGEPHEAEVVLVGELNPDGDVPYPSDDDLFAEIDRRCAALPDEISDAFGVLPVAPDEASWGPFAGRFLCVAIPYGGGTTVGSLL